MRKVPCHSLGLSFLFFLLKIELRCISICLSDYVKKFTHEVVSKVFKTSINYAGGKSASKDFFF